VALFSPTPPMMRPRQFVPRHRLIAIGVHGAEAGFDLWPHFLQGHFAIAVGVERAEAGIGHALGVFGVVMAGRAAAGAVAGAAAEGAEFLLGEEAVAIDIGLGEADLGAGPDFVERDPAIGVGVHGVEHAVGVGAWRGGRLGQGGQAQAEQQGCQRQGLGQIGSLHHIAPVWVTCQYNAAGL